MLASERQDMPCTYLVQHELESIMVITVDYVIIMLMLSLLFSQVSVCCIWQVDTVSSSVLLQAVSADDNMGTNFGNSTALCR